MDPGLRITGTVAKVLRQFLDDPKEPQYGFDLMRATKLPSGTLYPILARLQRAGWISCSQEDIDPAAAGRPRRRLYVISSDAVEPARIQLAELSEQIRPPQYGQRRPRLNAEHA
jgi:PadR family transcriptional regulator, regulatory protein PadR